MEYDPDDILKQAIRNLAGGVDLDTAHDAVADTLSGLREAAKAFKAMNFTEEPFHVKCGKCKAPLPPHASPIESCREGH